jgi:hypothetical protein
VVAWEENSGRRLRCIGYLYVLRTFIALLMNEVVSPVQSLNTEADFSSYISALGYCALCCTWELSDAVTR